MTDINKQIEEEAREYAFKSCPYHYSDCKIEHCNSNCQWHRYSQQDDSYKKFKQGAQFVLNSSRWRKVSEELPELGIEVIITRNDGIRFLAWLDKDTELFFNVSGNEEYFLDEIQSWKPID